MSRKKNPPPPPSKVPPGVVRKPGVLSCRVCKFSIPYQGYTEAEYDDRPLHRCVSEIRPFDKFDTSPAKIRVRQW